MSNIRTAEMFHVEASTPLAAPGPRCEGLLLPDSGGTVSKQSWLVPVLPLAQRVPITPVQRFYQ